MEQAVAAILVFAGASFFFALAETALFSLGKWQVAQLAEKKPRAGKTVAALLDHPQDLLATLALGNTFANAAMLAVALRMAFNAQWTLASLTLLGCEVLPKTLAVRQPERWALRVSWPLLAFQKATEPLHHAAQWVNAAILKKTAPQMAAAPALTDAEYNELLEMAYQQGTLAESEKEIILQIISLDQRAARDVMQPRAASLLGSGPPAGLRYAPASLRPAPQQGQTKKQQPTIKGTFLKSFDTVGFCTPHSACQIRPFQAEI
jgi:putative hemolysin